DLAQKGPLLSKDELVRFGEVEVGHAFGVTAQPRAIGLIGGKALERDQREGDVVGALMRHPVADEVAAAARDDREPAFGIFLELRALERIELVADEHGDRHWEPRCLLSSSLRAKRSNPERLRGTSLGCFVAALLAMTRTNIAPCPTTMLRLSSKHES